MPSISKIICDINSSLSGVIKGSDFFGITKTTEREGKSLPINDDRVVIFDDSYGLIGYHKVNEIRANYSHGFGDKRKVTNVFNCALVVFNNKTRTKICDTDIALIIQAALTNNSSYRISPLNIILNSKVVYDNEYRGNDFRLNENQSLLQINYQIEVVYNNCFEICPEDFINN